MRQLIIILGIIAVILSIVYGSVLPFKKAQGYIRFLHGAANTVRNIEDLTKEMDKIVKFYSPIGQEESVRYIANDILTGVLYGGNSEAADRAMTGYIEPYLFENDVRHLIILGEYHRALFLKYGKEEDYFKSEESYLKILEIAPKFPVALENIFDLYEEKGETDKMKSIGETILKYWPDNERVKKILENG